MSNAETQPQKIHTAPSPHIYDPSATTRRMMWDVVIALIPVVGASIYFFGWSAVFVIGLSTLSCLLFEALCQKARGRKLSLDDGSIAVTGVILGLSLPWSAPWHAIVIGGLAAAVLGKHVFGGLGFNIFNPAMVGRAFVMLSFAKALGAGAFVDPDSGLAIVTQATPLTAAKGAATSLSGEYGLWPLFIGSVNGSLGETSALAALAGGLFLCLRRSASWEIPTGALLSTAAFGGLAYLAGLSSITMLEHLIAGPILFGAFYIATDPVTSPVTPKGKFVFGVGVGMFAIMLRVFSSYPTGMMFSILLMNSATPLINRWTVPTPVGGPVPAPAPKNA